MRRIWLRVWGCRLPGEHPALEIVVARAENPSVYNLLMQAIHREGLFPPVDCLQIRAAQLHRPQKQEMG